MDGPRGIDQDTTASVTRGTDGTACAVCGAALSRIAVDAGHPTCRRHRDRRPPQSLELVLPLDYAAER